MKAKLPRVFWHYGFFALWALVAFLITRFLEPIPLGLMIAVFFMIFAPGFVLGRILRLDLESTLDKTIVSMAIGFVYVWLLAFAAILLGLNIVTLAIVWLVLLSIIFIAALVLEIKKPLIEVPKLKLKDIFNPNNLIWLLVFACAFLIIMYLVRTGALFKGGDANYHLATIRKVIGGEPLSINNLNYARDKMLIVYGFPVWHIFLGLVIKLAHSDIFIVWRDIAAALLGLAMMVWYWLARKIFPTRDLAILAWVVFSFFGFYWGPAFVYSTLGIPHTFAQLLLLPLAVGLCLTYVFNKPDRKLLAIIILLILTGAAVHITFYFYLLTILIFFLIFYAALGWSQPDWRPVIKRLATLIGVQIAVILPLALLLEIKGQVVSNYFKVFQGPNYQTDVKYHSLKDFSEFALYGFVGLPLVLMFIRRFPKLILLLAVLVVTPLVYFTPLKVFVSKLVGYVYVKRLYGNLDWNFLVWALVIGFILILVDRLILKIVQGKKYLRLGLNVGLGLVTAGLFYFQARTDWAGALWKQFFDGAIYDWLAQNYFWLIIILSLVSIVIFIWQIFRPKIQDFFNLEEAKAPLARFFLMGLLVLILAAPDWALFKTYLLEKSGPEFFWRSMTPVAKVRADIYSNSIGGEQIVEFINKNIPPKSVFDTDTGYFFLPVMVDQHLPIYHSTANIEHRDLYADETTLARRLDILHRYNIDYILVRPPKEGKSIIESLPQYFTKIFPISAASLAESRRADGEGKFMIYRVNKDQVNKDYTIRSEI